VLGSPGKMLPTNPTSIRTKASDKPMICSAVTIQYYRSQLVRAKTIDNRSISDKKWLRTIN
jgi:hypothetical protein